jgi:1-acyl-sn-glycerol-3-phosphate acyltransferase
MMREFLRITFALLFRVITRLRVQGFENIPFEGGCLLTMNHLGIVDAPILLGLIKRRDFTGLVAKKHQKTPGVNWIVNNAKGIWIDRDGLDMAAIKACQAYLVEGGMLGIAPEGTRSDDHQLIEPKPGVAFLAAKANVPIVPVAIWGTEDSLGKILRLARPEVNIRVGEAFYTPPLDRKDRDASLQRNTDEIMCQIAAMLPPKYRGVYANHPRLKELLH